MNNNSMETELPEIYASKVFEICGMKFDPKMAADLWPKILQHKWLLSEKLGRDVGERHEGISLRGGGAEDADAGAAVLLRLLQQ